MTPVDIVDTQGTLQARKTCTTPYKRPGTLIRVYIWWQMYWPKEPYDPKRKKHEIKYAFKKGDRVRTTFLHRPFQREYDTRWTGEIFKITRRFMR